jgi:hypothetical protein
MRSAVLRCAAAGCFAAFAAAVLMVAPVRAADPAPADNLQGQKPQAQTAAVAPATIAPAGKPAAAVRAPKPPRPAKPPEMSYEQQRAVDGLWAKRTSWLSFRAGYAKASGELAGDGLVGYGIAYQRMLTSRYSFGGSVQHDLVGHLGSSYEVSVPFALELTRHYKWKTAMRPYIGLGGGYYFHKYYRTAGDYTGSPGRGLYVNFGTNVPVDSRHLLGLDTRVSFVKTTEGEINPVFGPQKSSQTLWSVKLNWAFGYY